MNLEILEKSIGYTFKNKKLLKKALTHTSFANERKIESNEKLEFMGDSILEFLSSKYIYNNYQNLKEGEMTKVRAEVVCEDSLYKVAKKHNFTPTFSDTEFPPQEPQTKVREGASLKLYRSPIPP